MKKQSLITLPVSDKNQLKLYLTKQRLLTYEQALANLGACVPVTELVAISMCLQGTSGTGIHSVRVTRGLGSYPVLDTVAHGYYTQVSFQEGSILDLVATLVNPVDEKLLICVFNECSIINMKTLVSQDSLYVEEELEMKVVRVLPWKHIDFILGKLVSENM